MVNLVLDEWLKTNGTLVSVLDSQIRGLCWSKSHFGGFFYIIDDYLRAFEEVLCISTTKTKSSSISPIRKAFQRFLMVFNGISRLFNASFESIF